MRDAAHLADLDQHEARLGGDARGRSRPESVPFPQATTDVIIPCQLETSGLVEVLAPPARVRDVHVADDAVRRLDEVGVGEEAGVQEGDGHAPPAVLVGRADAQGRGQDRHRVRGDAQWRRRDVQRGVEPARAVAAQAQPRLPARACWRRPARRGRARSRWRERGSPPAIDRWQIGQWKGRSAASEGAAGEEA